MRWYSLIRDWPNKKTLYAMMLQEEEDTQVSFLDSITKDEIK